jgi:hypothetical protein
MASPTKVTITNTNTNPVTTLVTIQAASNRSVPCFKSSPQLGVGGGKPNPK